MSMEVALTESKAMRADYLTAVPNAAYLIPGLEFPEGRSVLLLSEVAEAFEVLGNTLQHVVNRNTDELIEHGYSNLTKEQSKGCGVPLRADYNYPRGVSVFSPAAVAVVGMLLESGIARQFRAQLIRQLQQGTGARFPVSLKPAATMAQVRALEARGYRLTAYDQQAGLYGLSYGSASQDADRFEAVFSVLMRRYEEAESHNNSYNPGGPYRKSLLETLRDWISGPKPKPAPAIPPPPQL